MLHKILSVISLFLKTIFKVFCYNRRVLMLTQFNQLFLFVFKNSCHIAGPEKCPPVDRWASKGTGLSLQMLSVHRLSRSKCSGPSAMVGAPGDTAPWGQTPAVSWAQLHFLLNMWTFRAFSHREPRFVMWVKVPNLISSLTSFACCTHQLTNSLLFKDSKTPASLSSVAQS